MLAPARDRPWRPRQQRVERESLATGTVAQVVGVGGPADDTSRPAVDPDRAAVDVPLGGPGPVDGVPRPAVDPDRATVNDARSGDAAAFERLVMQYQVRLVNYAAALVGDAGGGEDVAQEAFVRAWRGLGGFRGESSFKTWLYRIAANVARTHLERRGRQAPVFGRSLDDEAGPTPGAVVAATETDAETVLVTREAIDRALAELPEELRLALVLRDVEGLDYKEIASVTAAPIGTVESRIFRARRRMWALLRPPATDGAGASRRPARTDPEGDR